MKRRTVATVVLFIAASLAGGVSFGASPVQAGHCGSMGATVPPALPNAPQTGLSVAISGGYYGVGGPGPLDSYGCVAGQEVADTRVLPPRPDFVIVIVATKCTPGQALPTAGTSLKGLGANESALNLRCGSPDLKGQTAYVSELYPVRPGAAGTVTAVVNVNGRLMTAQSRSALPVDQPA